MIAKLHRDLGTFLVVLASLWALTGVAHGSALRPQVVEVTVATPDIVAVIVRDPPFIPGRLVRLAPSAAKSGEWVRHDGEWGRVVGPKRDHIRTSDIPPAAYLDRKAIDAAATYASISGRRVTNVYRKSMPFDSGVYRSASGETINGASFQHVIYLKLDAPLPQGSHRIIWPEGALAPTEFEWNADKTRAIALRVNQNGYAPGDVTKAAYLSLWLPGGPAHGVVDFAARGLSRFEIRDAGGRPVFSGPITLRRAPDELETGTGLGNGLIEYPDASAPAQPVTTATFGASGAVLTAVGHGLGGASRVWLQGFSGRLAHLNGNRAVRVDGADRLVLTDVTDGAQVWSRAELGSARPLIKSNRAGTPVYELDFSSWRPEQEGDHHIHVPGLGISDHFRVEGDVWLTAVRTAAAGLYHHRSGIALDGRFGTTRPAGFRPGTDVTVVQSRLPLIWTDNFHGGRISFTMGPSDPWRGEISNDPDLWGGYMDAGDWDRRIQHLEISSALMDLFEHAGPAARATALSIPKSHEVLDSKVYGELADAPDLLHEIAWGLDFYRRLQLPDGRVRGGMESGGHPLVAEPSFLESLPVYAYAPDHISGYRYAAMAARFARILDAEKKVKLAALFRTSAVNAWRAAEVGFADPDAFYAPSLKAAFASKAFDANSWAAFKTTLEKLGIEHRAGAAGALFRLTGEPGYREVFEASWRSGLSLYLHVADGAWDYIHAPGFDPVFTKAIRRGFKSEAARIIAPLAQSTYPALKHPDAPAGWGQGLVPDANALQLVMRAHMLTGDRSILDALLRTSAHILGANQVGLSFTTGLGHRNIRHPMHEDHRAMGVAAPSGITIYGWAPQWMTDHFWIFGPHWAPIQDDAGRDGDDWRRMEPNRFALPYYEYLVEHPGLIMQQEYTVHQSIGPTLAMWMYLHSQTLGQAHQNGSPSDRQLSR